MEKAGNEMVAHGAKAHSLNGTVNKYDSVYTNVLNFTHDFKCFSKDAEFIRNYAKKNPSYFFTVNFPKKPQVFVSISGITTSVNKSSQDTFYIQPIYDSDIYNDHFSMNMNYDDGALNYERIQICYYAYVNPKEYLPTDSEPAN